MQVLTNQLETFYEHYASGIQKFPINERNKNIQGV